MRGPLLLLGILALPAGGFCLLLAAALSGDRSVSFPFQIATMVLLPGGLLTIAIGLALPSQRARIDRALKTIESEESDQS